MSDFRKILLLQTSENRLQINAMCVRLATREKEMKPSNVISWSNGGNFTITGQIVTVALVWKKTALIAIRSVMS